MSAPDGYAYVGTLATARIGGSAIGICTDLLKCLTCLAVVTSEDTSDHDAWHRGDRT